MSLKRIFRGFCLWALLAAPLHAGLVMESTDQTTGSPAVTSKLYLDNAGLRAEAPESTVIFRPEKKVLWVLDASQKEYSQMTEADISHMGAQMDEAMRKMNEQMAQLPPEQRAMVAEMMKKQMPGGMPGTEPKPAPKVTFEKTASGETVGTWTCAKFVEKENGVKTGEIWTVPAATFMNFGPYFTTLQKLGNFFSKMPGAQAKAMEFPLLKASAGEESGLSGIPVKDIRYRNDGTVSSQWELKKISEEAVDAALFEVPAGYKQHSLLEEKEESH